MGYDNTVFEKSTRAVDMLMENVPGMTLCDALQIAANLALSYTFYEAMMIINMDGYNNDRFSDTRPGF